MLKRLVNFIVGVLCIYAWSLAGYAWSGEFKMPFELCYTALSTGNIMAFIWFVFYIVVGIAIMIINAMAIIETFFSSVVGLSNQ